MHTNSVVIWRIGNWKIDLKKREEEVKETKIDNHSNLVKNLFEKEFTPELHIAPLDWWLVIFDVRYCFVIIDWRNKSEIMRIPFVFVGSFKTSIKSQLLKVAKIINKRCCQGYCTWDESLNIFQRLNDLNTNISVLCIIYLNTVTLYAHQISTNINRR